MTPLQFPATRMLSIDPVALAVRDVDVALATFMDAILCARTPEEALHLRDEISICVLKLAALESSALDRADRLCGRTA